MERRPITSMALALTANLGLLALLWGLWVNRHDPLLAPLWLNNLPVIIGLPCAAIAAFTVVAILRQRERPLDFEGLGFKFRGPSGEIVLWIGCFLAIVGAIWLLYKR
jgi:hypothetical protein